MPVSTYDAHFGGNALKAKRAMAKQYGKKKGTKVFYATMNKKKKKESRGKS